MLQDLQGKCVLITGASTGIGASAALAFARMGARVALHYNRREIEARAVAAEIEGVGGQCYPVQADLGDPEAASGLVHVAADALGGLDILVNNAGALMSRTMFLDWNDELYEKVMNLNVRAVIKATQAAVPYMVARSGGAVVNLGSIAGNNGGGPGSGLYASAKAFVHNVTRHMATDLAAKNIRVNAIAPGVISTAFHAETPGERMLAMKNSVPMGRIGEPSDCAGAILFLASSQMSGYITGQVLHVNGGQMMPA